MKDLRLCVIEVHPAQGFIECPYCKNVGRHIQPIQREVRTIEYIGRCEKCDGSFIIRIASNSNRTLLMQGLAEAIREILFENEKSLTAIVAAKKQIEGLLDGTPDLDCLGPRPVFEVGRNVRGNLEVQAMNVTASSILDLLGKNVVIVPKKDIKDITDLDLEGV